MGHVEPQGQPSLPTSRREGTQGIVGEAALTRRERGGVDRLAFLLDRSAPARIIQPHDPHRLNWDRVDERHRAVLAGRIAERDIEERRTPLTSLNYLEAQPDRLVSK